MLHPSDSFSEFESPLKSQLSNRVPQLPCQLDKSHYRAFNPNPWDEYHAQMFCNKQLWWELCGSLLNLQLTHRHQANPPALLLCTIYRPQGNGAYGHQKKLESIPLTGMVSVLTQTRLFLVNEVERLRVLSKFFSSCQSSQLPAPFHTPTHRHTASQVRGGGARKHEGLRSTKKPRILAVNQKILLILESIYHFHSKVFMNNFFFKSSTRKCAHVDLSFTYE